MRQWQYLKLDLNNRPRKTEDIDVLNDAGNKGWELVNLNVNNIAYLKGEIHIERPEARKTTKQTAET